MKLNRTGSRWDRNQRININDNWDEIERESSRLSVIGRDAEKALIEAYRTHDMNNNTNRRLDNMIGELTTDSELVDARMGHSLLSGNLSAIKRNVDSTSSSLVNTSNPRPLITFIDDDINYRVYTVLKPIFEERGVPLTIAAPSSYIDKPGFLTLDQGLELQNELGWEVASHGIEQIQLNDLTRLEAERQLRESKEVLENYGFDINHYVYGYGYPNRQTRDLTRRYYKSGINAQEEGHMGINSMPIKQYKVNRSGLGSFNGNRTLEDYKERIDKAIDEGGWLIFMLHVAATDEQGLSDLEDTLDYAISRGVEIVNYDDGFKEFGNVIFKGDYLGEETEGPYHIVTNTGETFIGDDNLNQDVRVDTPLSDFPLGYSTHSFLSNHNSGFPTASTGGAGTLITHRAAVNQLSASINFQIFIPAATKSFHMRYAKSNTNNSEWSEFLEYKHDPQNEIDYPSIKPDPNEHPSTFPEARMTSYQYNVTEAQEYGLPQGKRGTLIVHNGTHPTFAFQEYHISGTNTIMRRYYVGGEAVWSDFA